MQKQLEILNTTRNNILNTIKELSTEQLNKIPTGFKNNVAWNLAHLVVTQQLLCYKLSGLEMYIDDNFVELFKKGSEATYEINQDEADAIKEQLLALPKKLAADYNAGLFKNYTEYPTSYNVTLNNIEEAIQFNNVHEGLHFGYIMALRKIV